ncbi:MULTISPECIES: flavodoxin family protein [Methanothrix]|jgi:Multimeric flavodoxin WrbA|uniref:NADPH-dependent FMN reductase n=1 Tax=Methanothrix thermoacetophila (strain DSM 6194 / JCM 14653 / NBRC 101360 / PT) TaxID=349307 RepID=A0B5I9_METTP|nr:MULTISPECIES: flavodoxin family protein [Methanothrix]ABK13963.1 NADPH-dependent FMN reductase [Methanothrix thermoacetophila PT]NPU88011.1 flavodoxin family protein [Methanothrix sp.]
MAMVLGISGSPKSGRNTEYLLQRALRVASERGYRTESVLCSRLRVGFCTDCGECSKGKPCPIDDDMVKIYELLQNADGIVVASPVYFGSVTAQLKAIFDRTLPLRRQGFRLRDKAGCAIAVGGSRNGGQEKTIEAIHAWMHIHGMIVVGDNSHFGGIAVRPAENDDVGISTVEATASKLCDLLDLKKKGGCWSSE